MRDIEAAAPAGLQDLLWSGDDESEDGSDPLL